MPGQSGPIHVSLVAIPEAAISTLAGIYDVLNSFRMLADLDPSIPQTPPFVVDIVSLAPGDIPLVSGLPIRASRAHRRCRAHRSHHRAVACGRCIGLAVRPLSATRRLGRAHARARRDPVLGLFGHFPAGRNRTIRRPDLDSALGLRGTFAKTFPRVPLQPDRVLIAAGERDDLVSSGASNSWHDLVLYLIVRFVGATAAQTIARSFALQWHHDGLAPYIVFEGRKDHGDAVIADVQDWLAKNFSVGSPIDEMVRRSGLAERTFKRRFTDMTGFAPIDYVQRLRVEDAKRRLERTDAPVEEISWRVGYEDPAFFRRLFKRVTGLSPGHYRKRFQVPGFAKR